MCPLWLVINVFALCILACVNECFHWNVQTVWKFPIPVAKLNIYPRLEEIKKNRTVRIYIEVERSWHDSDIRYHSLHLAKHQYSMRLKIGDFSLENNIIVSSMVGSCKMFSGVINNTKFNVLGMRRE